MQGAFGLETMHWEHSATTWSRDFRYFVCWSCSIGRIERIGSMTLRMTWKIWDGFGARGEMRGRPEGVERWSAWLYRSPRITVGSERKPHTMLSAQEMSLAVGQLQFQFTRAQNLSSITEDLSITPPVPSVSRHAIEAKDEEQAVLSFGLGFRPSTATIAER